MNQLIKNDVVLSMFVEMIYVDLSDSDKIIADDLIKQMNKLKYSDDRLELIKKFREKFT